MPSRCSAELPESVFSAILREAVPSLRILVLASQAPSVTFCGACKVWPRVSCVLSVADRRGGAKMMRSQNILCRTALSRESRARCKVPLHRFPCSAPASCLLTTCQHVIITATRGACGPTPMNVFVICQATPRFCRDPGGFTATGRILQQCWSQADSRHTPFTCYSKVICNTEELCSASLLEGKRGIGLPMTPLVSHRGPLIHPRLVSSAGFCEAWSAVTA